MALRYLTSVGIGLDVYALREVYLPDFGIVCNAKTTAGYGMDESASRSVTANAFYSEMRNSYGRGRIGEPASSATHEVRLPRRLVRQLVELAELTRRQSELSAEAGAALLEAVPLDDLHELVMLRTDADRALEEGVEPAAVQDLLAEAGRLHVAAEPESDLAAQLRRLRTRLQALSQAK